jgi:hypothetical protein
MTLSAPAAKRYVTEIREALAIIEPDLALARQNLRDWSANGLESSGETGSRSGPSDPTAAAALARAASRDEWRTKLVLIDERLVQARQLLYAISIDVHELTQPAMRTGSDAGCVLCAEHADGAFQPTYTTRPRQDLEDGDLIGYCSFHAKWLDRYGEDAARPITRWHLDHLGQRIPKNLIREHHPDAYPSVHSTPGRAERYTDRAQREAVALTASVTE